MWKQNARFVLFMALWLVCSGSFGDVQAVILEGYPSETSVLQGDTLELHVRSDAATYSVTLCRQGQTLEQVATLGNFAGSNWPVPAESWQTGCGWPVTCRFATPAQWRPGAYAARLDAPGQSAWIPFVVRARIPGSTGPILVMMSTATWQAYNRYGGKNLYESYIPSNPGRSARVSYLRPYSLPSGLPGSGLFFMWDAPFISFLESQGYAFEVCTSIDLHRNPGILDHYRMFVSVGHDEYWSKEQYDEVERFANAGGNLAFFAGNVLWWQVRYEDREHRIVCYKSAALDPLNGIDNSRVTVNWHVAPVLRPPAQLMGVYYNGSSGITPGCYEVFNPRHWAYRGVTVDSAQCFGYPMVAYEIDARCVASPPKLDVIAHTLRPDIPDGGVMRPADMVYYERSPAYGFPDGKGGKIFAAGTINYVQGITNGYNAWTKTVGGVDPVAVTITRNVLDRLGCSLSEPRLGAPADGAQVRGSRVLLQWYPAVPQRAEIPSSYALYWGTGPAHVDSLITASISAWVPVGDDSSYLWWVRATCECGETRMSSRRSFHASIPSGQPEIDQRPLLTIERFPGHVAMTIAPEYSSLGWLRVFDVAGRVVRVYEDRIFDAPTTRIDWDLRNSVGVPVPAGIYLVHARVGTRSARDRILLVH